MAAHDGRDIILGIRPEMDGLRIDPCIPSGWPGFEMRRRLRGSTIIIKVSNPSGKSRGIHSLKVNGKQIAGNLLPSSELTDGAIVEATIG